MDESNRRITRHYDDLADAWAQITDSPSRSRILWPAVDAMLPDLTGRRILDAGFGSGVYAEKLVERGAEVVGVDASGSMVRRASERVPDASFTQADLGRPLAFVEDDSVDVVLCQHVFSHLPDLTTALGEFARILVDGGVLVVSTHNPVHDYLVALEEAYPTRGEGEGLEAAVETDPGLPNYAETERYDIVWNPGPDANRATYYRRSFEGLVSPLLDAGFELRDVTEPTPDEAFERDHPDVAEALRAHPPASICLCAVRRTTE